MIIEDTDPPDGSKISVEYIGDEIHIVIPFRRFFAEKLVQAIMSVIMFCAVVFFAMSGVWELFVADQLSWSVILKLIIPAILATLSLLSVLAIFKVPLPQRLSLCKNNLLLETGGANPTSIINIPLFARERGQTNSIFSDSERVSLSMGEIRSIRLETSTLSVLV